MSASLPSIEGLTVLVTGGAGFVGSHLVDALADGNEVRVLDDCSTGDPSRLPEPVQLFEGDVRDAALVERAVDGVDLIYHEAALVDAAASVDRPLTWEAVNVEGTLTVLEAARAVDARVVFASSAAVYGHPDRVPVGEDHARAPANPYGLTKLAGDEYCRLYHELHGVETVALRYFNVYGPRQSGGQYSGVIDVFLRQARSGEPITVHGDGAQTRDFVHVSDVVRANLLAATTEHVGEAFNVGTGESVSVLELAELVRDATGSDSAIEHVDARPGDVERSEADVSAAAEALGYAAQVDLESGLGRLAERGT